jgi:hypothetical protein
MTATTNAFRKLLAFSALLGCALLALGTAQAMAAVPAITNDFPTAVTDTTATLNGTVKTDSALTDCHFEYVDPAAHEKTQFSDLSSGGSAPCVPAAGSIPADSAPHAVSAAIARPAPGAPLYYRLVAENASGPAAGSYWRAVGFGLTGFDGEVLDELGDPETRAGSHPDTASTTFSTTTTV